MTFLSTTNGTGLSSSTGTKLEHWQSTDIDRPSFEFHSSLSVGNVAITFILRHQRLVKEFRPIREKRGLFIFFLPPYSPHLNIAETLWRILKGKWLRPVDYFSSDSLLYATNRALAALGSELNINFAHTA